MEVFQPESVWIKKALETITLKPGKRCYSLSIKNPHFVMHVIMKNNHLPHKKIQKPNPLLALCLVFPIINSPSLLTILDTLKLRRKLLLIKLSCIKSGKMLKLLIEFFCPSLILFALNKLFEGQPLRSNFFFFLLRNTQTGNGP